MVACDKPSFIFVSKHRVDEFGTKEPTEECDVRILCRYNFRWICSPLPDELFHLISNLHSRVEVWYVSKAFMTDPANRDITATLYYDIDMLQNAAHKDGGVNPTAMHAYIRYFKEKRCKHALSIARKEQRRNNAGHLAEITLLCIIMAFFVFFFCSGFIFVCTCITNTVFQQNTTEMCHPTCEGYDTSVSMMLRSFGWIVALSLVIFCIYKSNPQLKHYACIRLFGCNTCRYQSEPASSHYLFCPYTSRKIF